MQNVGARDRIGKVVVVWFFFCQNLKPVRHKWVSVFALCGCRNGAVAHLVAFWDRDSLSFGRSNRVLAHLVEFGDAGGQHRVSASHSRLHLIQDVVVPSCLSSDPI